MTRTGLYPLLEPPDNGYMAVGGDASLAANTTWHLVADFTVVDSAHSAHEAGNAAELIAATDRFLGKA